MIALETSRFTPHRPIAFLDRDGVIIHNRDDYVRSWQDVRFVPGAVAAVARLAAAGFSIAIVTNQACIGKGLLPEAAAIDLHEQITAAMGSSGAPVAASYICPHEPSARCACRKPRPGMLEYALRSLSVPPTGSFMVGDAVSDVLAAEAARLTPALVLTGRGVSERTALASPQRERIAVHDSLGSLVTDLLAAQGPDGLVGADA